MRCSPLLIFCSAIFFLSSCSNTGKKETQSKTTAQVPPSYFKPDPATTGSLVGTIQFSGARPRRKPIDMSEDPACVEAHRGKPFDESVMVNPNNTLANVFIYIKSGLEGKRFEVPTNPVTIDQRGCWFHPRVFGIQTGQILHVTNSDPVTHNIHPLAQINREWNHSQGPEDPPLTRKFIRPEIMIPVKCNIHRWMHAFIGVVDHPYFAVSGSDGAFSILGVPPGNYVIEARHETLGTQQQNVTVPPSGKVTINFHFKENPQ
jgi:hypothetical protein